jgi:hypothetical protein
VDRIKDLEIALFEAVRALEGLSKQGNDNLPTIIDYCKGVLYAEKSSQS